MLWKFKCTIPGVDGIFMFLGTQEAYREFYAECPEVFKKIATFNFHKVCSRDGMRSHAINASSLDENPYKDAEFQVSEPVRQRLFEVWEECWRESHGEDEEATEEYIDAVLSDDKVLNKMVVSEDTSMKCKECGEFTREDTLCQWCFLRSCGAGVINISR